MIKCGPERADLGLGSGNGDLEKCLKMGPVGSVSRTVKHKIKTLMAGTSEVINRTIDVGNGSSLNSPSGRNYLYLYKLDDL